MGKYLCCADLHITSNPPIFRVDNYLETSLNKLRWIVEFANKNWATILIAGDLFENLRVGYKVVNRVIEILKESKFGVIATPGQHDKYYHNENLHDTPIYNVAQSKAINLLGYGEIIGAKDPIFCLGHDYPEDLILKAETSNGILLAHRCVTKGTPPFFLKDANDAKTFLHKFKNFKFIVTGDYHVPFIFREENRILINCGTMLRSDKDQIKFLPQVHLLDTKKDKVKTFYIPIKPAETVFDFNLISISDKSNFSEEVEELLQTISEDGTPNFLVNLDKVCKKSKLNERTSKIISNYVNKYGK